MRVASQNGRNTRQVGVVGYRTHGSDVWQVITAKRGACRHGIEQWDDEQHGTPDDGKARRSTPFQVLGDLRPVSGGS